MAIFCILGENTQVWSSSLEKCKTRSSRRLLLARPICGHKRLALAVVIVGGFLLLRVFAQEGPPELQSIRGQVINNVTREPIGRALVFSTDNRFATLTDSEGHFELSIPAPSAANAGDSGALIRTAAVLRESLRARKPGFLDYQGRGSTPVVPGRELTISLVPEALIVGHVVLPSSEASDRIQVELYHRRVQNGRARWTMQQQTTSKSTGEFRFADLPAGSYKLLTRELLDTDPVTFNQRGPQFGYPPVYFPAAGEFLSAEVIQLTAGQTFQADITLVRQPYYPVKIVVANAQPGVGMQVIVAPQGHWGPGYALGTREQTIDGLLPSGTYTVEAASFGADPVTGSMSFTVKGAPLVGPNMTLVADTSMPVSVKEEFNDPENGSAPAVTIINGGTRHHLTGPGRYLNIQLEPVDDFGLQQGAFLRPPVGPEDTSLVIDKVKPGRYWVKVDSSRGFASSVTCGGVDLKHQPLVISGGSSDPIEVTMRDDWAEVDGTIDGVASPFGENEAAAIQDQVYFEAAAHIYFVPLPDSSGEFHEAWAGRDGKFRAQQIQPGAYRVLAFDREQPELEFRDPEAMRAYDNKGQVVRLLGNQKEQLRLQLISTSE